jgi:N6-adenosine-specific RNA methylase IME4
VAVFDDLTQPEAGGYGLIYADPPWNFSNANITNKDGPMRVNDKYATMGLDELKGLPVGRLAAADSALVCWTTDAHLEWALECVRSWGFSYSTVLFVWVKLTSTGRPSCELALLGTRGKARSSLLVSKNQFQLIEEERGEHSVKPEGAYERLEAMFPNTGRIELFARRSRQGWDQFGDQVDLDLLS